MANTVAAVIVAVAVFGSGINVHHGCVVVLDVIIVAVAVVVIMNIVMNIIITVFVTDLYLHKQHIISIVVSLYSSTSSTMST